MVKAIDDWRKKRKIKREQISFARRWPFALLTGALLGVLALVDKGSLTADAFNSPCRVKVTEVFLFTRNDPDLSAPTTNDKLRYDDVRGATTNVRNGFRQLADNTWALDKYLRLVPPVAEKCKVS